MGNGRSYEKEARRMRIDTKSMSYEEWKQARRKGIGGSDAAAVAGVSRYKSPLQVYLEKIGEIENNVDNEYVHFGKILEEVVAKEFEERTGKKVRRVNSILIHPEYPWMIANIDRKIVGEDAVLECKTTSAYNAKEWKENVPQEYIIQVQHYLAVTGYPKAYIAVLIGGNHFEWREIERDEELIKKLIDVEKDFWFHVEAKIPPEVDGSEASTKILETLYHDSVDKEILLPQDVNKLVEERNALVDQIKQLTEMKNEKENKIKAMMKENETAKTDKYVISWKKYVSKRFDTKAFKKEHSDLYEKYVKESSSRRFAIKEV
jgi:putative phage-type endonuclease